MEFRLRRAEGHIIMTVDGQDWLVDTGSPFSFGNGELVLGDEMRQVSSRFMGIGADFLSRHVGIPLQGLIGTDVMNSYNVVFDLPNGVIRMGLEEEPPAGMEIPIDIFMGVPVLSATVNGSGMRCFFDTGAQVSYVPEGILRPEDWICAFQDFYPTQGAFETQLHWSDLILGSKSYRIRAGIMPGFMAGLMGMTDVSAIIGNEIMPENVVRIYPSRNVLAIG